MVLCEVLPFCKCYKLSSLIVVVKFVVCETYSKVEFVVRVTSQDGLSFLVT